MSNNKNYVDFISSPTISSNTLFHFTDEEKLISILKEGFKPHLCMEDLNFFLTDEELTKEDTEDFQHAIPMICFCDIPLSQSKNHMNTYGNFGVGLKKDWGKQKSISPVLYAYKKSKITSVIQQIMINFHDDISMYDKLTYDLYLIHCFTKEYEGKLWEKKEGKFSGEIIRFYDEREWRYVPPIEKLHDYCLHKREYLDNSIRSPIQDRLDKMPLNFEASHIKYIIVSSEEEIIHIIDEIEEMDRFDKNDKKLLYSRIISAKQINEDF